MCEWCPKDGGYCCLCVDRDGYYDRKARSRGKLVSLTAIGLLLSAVVIAVLFAARVTH